ncbi:MAG: ABC transporter substrate-binding protein [Actinomycetota bacterium]
MRRTLTRLGVVAAILAVATVGLAACSSNNTDDSSSSTTRASKCAGPADAYTPTIGDPADFEPVTPDTLTVVTSLPGPGFFEGSDSDPTRITSGYEYDIAKKLQAAFGLEKLVIRNESFDAIVAGQVSDYDVSFSQISITCDRAEVVDFSVPYFESNQGVLVREGTEITDLTEAKDAQWGVQTGTTAIDLLDKVKPSKQTRVYQQLPDGFTALEAGQIDAFLVDTAIVLGQAARSGGRLVVVSQFEQPGGPDQYGAIIPKGSKNVGAINAVLSELDDSGELASLARQDLSGDPASLPVITVK